MSLRLKPYPAMKDSGVPWLRELPEHWNVMPALAVYRPKLVKNSGMVERTVLSLSYGRIIVKPEEKLRGLVPESFETYQIVDPGNIIIRTTDLQNDHTSLRIGYSMNRGIITSAYMCLATTECVSSAFGYQYLNVWDLLKIIYGFGSGLRQNLDFSDIKRMPVLVPPAAEQLAIVRFLDHADKLIRRLIAAKRRLIELLNEQKQAIIQKAVTRGLDPSTTYTSSGLQWLDKHPSHWRLIPIKHLLSRMDYGTSQVSTETGNIRLLTMANIQRGEVILPRLGGVDAIAQELLLEHHDLLFTRTNGNPDLVGKVGIFRGEISDNITFASYLVRLRVKPPNNPEWLHMVLNSSDFWSFARSHALVNLQTNLNSTRYGQFQVPVPSPTEQLAIIERTRNESRSLTDTIQRLEDEIACVREYRTRLIADVVTGKLDVRGVELPPMEEAEELPPVGDEALDEAIEEETELEPVEESVDAAE